MVKLFFATPGRISKLIENPFASIEAAKTFAPPEGTTFACIFLAESVEVYRKIWGWQTYPRQKNCSVPKRS